MNAHAAPRTARKKRGRWAAVAAVVLVVVMVAIVAPNVMGRGAKSETDVPTTTVAVGKLVISTAADGYTEADDTYDVYPEVSGSVQTVDVKVGDKIEAGESLFVLDDAPLRSAVRETSAQLSQAEQQVAAATQQVAAADQQIAAATLQRLQAENELERLESLTGTVAVSSSRIEEAENGVVVAKSAVTTANTARKAAQASVKSARAARTNAQSAYEDALEDLDKATVVAPVSGVVTKVGIVEGGSVSTGGGATAASGASVSSADIAGASAQSASTGSSAPIVISENSVLSATVAVNEVDIADVQEGQEATVTFDAAAGLAIPARVRWISPNSVTSGNVRTYDVELELAEQNERLRPGMTASAMIAIAELDDALLVPMSALRVDGTKRFVTVVNADGSQEKRTVTTGRSDDVSIQILTGLTEGEKVATSFTAPEESESGGFMPPRPPGGMGGN